MGRLPTYASEEVCGRTSSTWKTGWDGLRITRLRIFEESSPTNLKEYVYDPVIVQYVESPAPGGSNQPRRPTRGSGRYGADGPLRPTDSRA